MIVKVNGVAIENADWRVNGETGELRFESENGISDIQDAYMPNTEVIIELFNDDETMKAQWYVRNLVSISYVLNDVSLKWEVHAKFQMSANPISEIDDIKEASEESDDAIIELGAAINNLEEQQEELKIFLREQNTTVNRVSELLNSAMDRIAALENRGN